MNEIYVEDTKDCSYTCAVLHGCKKAIERLQIPRSTFYHLLEAGVIPPDVIVYVPLRKQAFYDGEKINKLAAERAKYLEELQREPERLVLTVPNREDLEQLAEIDRMVFHEETLIPPEEQMKRFAYNPECMQVLKDTKTNTILGDITMSPLKHDVLEKLIKLEIDETQIKPEDYQPYSTKKPQDIYVITIIARPGLTETFYGGRLLHAGVNYLIELLEKGIMINRLYTVATTEDGDRIARELGFTPLPGERMNLEHEDFRRSYVLDLEAKGSKSKLVRKYLQHRRNLERRQKRYKKQSNPAKAAR